MVRTVKPWTCAKFLERLIRIDLWLNWVKLHFGIASSHRSECLWCCLFTILNWIGETTNRETCWCKINSTEPRHLWGWWSFTLTHGLLWVCRMSAWTFYADFFSYHISISIFPMRNTWLKITQWQDFTTCVSRDKRKTVATCPFRQRVYDTTLILEPSGPIESFDHGLMQIMFANQFPNRILDCPFGPKSSIVW